MPESLRRTVFRNARLVDGTGAPPRAGVDVVLEGGRIASVGGSVAVGDAEVIELQGRTLMPGLIDCHVHLTFSGEAQEVERAATIPVPDLAWTAATNARETLAGRRHHRPRRGRAGGRGHPAPRGDRRRPRARAADARGRGHHLHDGGPWLVHRPGGRRARRRAARGARAAQGRRRLHQVHGHRRRDDPRRRPARLLLHRGGAGSRRRRGAQGVSAGDRPRPGERGHQDCRAGRDRLRRAWRLSRRRSDRGDAPARHVPGADAGRAGHDRPARDKRGHPRVRRDEGLRRPGRPSGELPQGRPGRRAHRDGHRRGDALQSARRERPGARPDGRGRPVPRRHHRRRNPERRGAPRSPRRHGDRRARQGSRSPDRRRRPAREHRHSRRPRSARGHPEGRALGPASPRARRPLP